jgi:hypothetical protein
LPGCQDRRKPLLSCHKLQGQILRTGDKKIVFFYFFFKKFFFLKNRFGIAPSIDLANRALAKLDLQDFGSMDIATYQAHKAK